MTSSDVFWWWADADGALRTVSEAELHADLAAGRVPARTLVWRSGWLSWARASQVAELHAALPGYAREHAIVPKLGPASHVPPGLPRGSGLGATALINRSDLTTPPSTEVTSAPRAAVDVKAIQELDAHDVVELKSKTKHAAPREDVIIPVESAPDHEPPTELRGQVMRPEADDGPTRVMAPIEKLPSWRDEVDAEIARTNAPQVNYAFADTIAPPPRKGGGMGWLLLLGGAVVLGGLGVVGAGAAYWYSTTRAAVQSESAKAPVAPPPAPAAPPVVQACKLNKAATRIAKSVEPGVPPYLSQLPGSDRVVVGLADGDHSALGLAVNVETLAYEQKLARLSSGRTLGVVPVTSDHELSFVVDMEGDKLAFARTVDAPRRFQIGMGRDGVSRVVDNGQPQLLWPLAPNSKLTEPRVASLSDAHALTFRSGGSKGKVEFGWLAADGAKRSELFAVSVNADRVGTPNVAADKSFAVVSFAAQKNEDWRVMLARAKRGAAPDAAIPFDLPSGGPGGDAISPAIASLGDGRWLLQWTEGSSDRRVRVQTLDSELAPVGEPIAVSAAGANSGQGEIWSDGKHALSVFLVKAGGGYELWATSLNCE